MARAIAKVRKTVDRHARQRIVAWHLIVSSFRGMSFGAEHWYAKLRTNRSASHEVTFKITAAEAAALNAKDRFASYRKGTPSNRFTSRATAIAAALLLFEREAPPYAVLLRGNEAVADPQEPLAGPPRVVAELRAIWEAAERSGGWDGNDRMAMQAAADRWDAWWATHK